MRNWLTARQSRSMRTTGASSAAVHCIQHARVISKGLALVTRASSNARRCRATRSGITRFVRCEASRHHPTTEQVPDSSYNEARRSSSGTATTRRLRQRRQQSHRQQQQQQHTQELSDAQEPSTSAADVVNYNTQQQQGSDGSSTAASESSTPATAISSEQDLNPTTQPVSLLVVELMAPSYAIARMVRIINDDAQLNFTSVAAYAAVEFNKWTHEKRSFRDSSTVKIPDSSYLNMCGSIRDPAVQQQLLSMIQHQLQQSADDYLSTGRGIDGVLVFAAPPSITYSMPVWHLPALTEEGVEESPYWVDDLNSRLFDADRIVVAVLQTYQSIKALCAAVQHPITQSPVPCGLILQNDWVDLQQQQHSGAAVLQQQNEAESSTSRRRQTASSSSSSRRIGSSSGEARNPDLQQRQQLPVILGLHNRPFLEPYLSGVVTHGPLHVVKHYWCSDGHLTRPVTPSVIISDVPGIRGNKCWCGSCDMPLWQMSDEERQQMMQQDSRYLQPKTAQPPPATTAAAAAGGSRRLSRMPHIQQSPPSSPPARLPGQQPPRSVWPEAFVMTAVMTFRQHVAQQMIAAAVAAAAAAGEGRSAIEEFVQSAAASSSAARDAATAQLAAANSRARGGARKKRSSSSSSSSDADLSIQPGQTVSQRTQQLLQRPVTVRGMLWPLLDRYNISFRKKGNKAELVDIVVNYERRQGLLLEDEQQQQ